MSDFLTCRFSLQVVSPMCLFYLNSKGTLMPVAIQLFTKPRQDNPVRYIEIFLHTVYVFSILVLKSGEFI